MPHFIQLLQYYDSSHGLPMNYYSVMEVERHQNVLDIRRSYKTLSRRYHPDKNSGPDAELAFTNVKLAYDVCFSIHHLFCRCISSARFNSWIVTGFDRRKSARRLQSIWSREFGIRSSQRWNQTDDWYCDWVFLLGAIFVHSNSPNIVAWSSLLDCFAGPCFAWHRSSVCFVRHGDSSVSSSHIDGIWARLLLKFCFPYRHCASWCFSTVLLHGHGCDVYQCLKWRHRSSEGISSVNLFFVIVKMNLICSTFGFLFRRWVKWWERLSKFWTWRRIQHPQPPVKKLPIAKIKSLNCAISLMKSHQLSPRKSRCSRSAPQV